jgi:glycosyltransferase involved in cell wall biosynthesis
MRLAYVTAHHPPDFTSGATLQVQRLARRAVELGHEVEVLSGAIAMGLGDGEMRTETVDGVIVHWIGTAERVEQDVDANWDNPLAATAARRWLGNFEPDVVHVHTLQTLGVGVVEAALDAGRRVVVTMHDLWWWCPRLFLVDTALRPCPMVTDVGTCACARTAEWRTERALRLRTTLARVDEVLTPSAVLREVVIANGVDPWRVTVDENDVADAVAPATAPAPTRRPVRFLYMGGDSALKGAEVLRRAAGSLADRPGWTLSAFGLSAGDGLAEQVRVSEPFDPSRLSAILGEHDVLLIPSIARESFSIAAREALLAGLAVVTSDCLGPEEVVRDGVNGLVVPTGDATALAAAMGSLVDDPARLDRLRAGVTESPVSVRTTGEHVADLLDRYANPPTVGTRRRWNVAFVVGADGAIARYRTHHPREALGLHGASTRVMHYLDPTLGRVADGMDAVVLQRVPATVHVLELVERWRAAGVLVVFDVDDLIVDPTLVDEIPGLQTLDPPERERYVDGLHRYRTTLEHCDGVIVPTSPLAGSIARTTGLPVAVVPNALGLVELRLADAASRSAAAARRSVDGRIRLSYFSGSDSHQPDLDMISEALAEVLRARPDVHLLLVGRIAPSPNLAGFGDRVRHRGVQPWVRLYEQLADVDVNLAPLVQPSEFNEAKSAIKWLEAGAVGVATVASATGPFAGAIDDGRTGVLCRSPDDWYERVVELVDDSARRRQLGRAAQREVELAHGPHVTAFAYLDALDDLAARRSRRPATSWIDRAPDERAPSAPPLEIYDLGLTGRTDNRIGGRLRRWRRLLAR